MRKFGKPRGRYARVAFELALRNLGLITSYSGWPLPSTYNQPAIPGAPHGLGHSMRADQRYRSLRLGPSPDGHGPDRPYRGDRGRLPPGPLMNQPWTTVSKQPQPGRPDWTTVTLVSDSFPRKRKPPPRVTLLVGMTHQREECSVNLQAGVRVSPSGTLLCLHVSKPGSDGLELTPLLPLDATRSSPCRRLGYIVTKGPAMSTSNQWITKIHGGKQPGPAVLSTAYATGSRARRPDRTAVR